MDLYEVRTTRQVEEQMAEIVHYLSRELLEPQLANALLTALENSMASLSTLPQRALLVAEEPWHSRGIRRLLCKNFLIYFSIEEAARRVVILGVVYARRNQLHQLKNLDF